MIDFIENFVTAVKQQDSRNKFIYSTKQIFCNPINLLYNKWQPDDVEIVFKDLTAIHFYPPDKFDILLEEYSFSESGITVFASWEGDPILIKNDKIYIAIHGAGSYIIDKEFISLQSFLEWIIQNMK